jgi:hypothetical protein
MGSKILRDGLSDPTRVNAVAVREYISSAKGSSSPGLFHNPINITVSN